MPYEKLDISSPKPVLSWANHALGGQETQMAKNVAGLPFVFIHLSVLSLIPPDYLPLGNLHQLSVFSQQFIVSEAFCF